jgi:glutathione synthase/RimK-type ligase-like ATP-grasp enzyme
LKPLLVVDAPKRWPLDIPGTELVSSYAYLSDPAYAGESGRKVFNLCRSYKYQAAGYYVSLLAEARGHRPLPSIMAIQDLRLTPVIEIVSQDLDELIQSNLKRIKADEFTLSIYFGRNLAESHNRLALALFNAFPAPLLRARFRRGKAWQLQALRVIGLGEVPDRHRAFVVEQAERYLRRAPRKSKAAPPTRHHLAILHDPNDPLPPSSPKTLKRIIEVGESLGIACELIQKDAYGRIAEYDALLIRETTAVNHHTYRFARRAQAEGIVVVDDPLSIVRCTNKVLLAETMTRHRLPTPKTLILSKDNALEGLRSLGFPCVLKRPDSAFSSGVARCENEAEAEAMLSLFFEQSDLLVAQAYVPTDFDWRIGVLGGEPIFACRYGMAPDHWQIVKRDGDGIHEGDSETLRVEDAPEDVVRLGVRAANLMGDGLYGVDLKVVHGKPVVIEVNDNPNLDMGVEDAVIGDALYVRLMNYFLSKLQP